MNPKETKKKKKHEMIKRDDDNYKYVQNDPKNNILKWQFTKKTIPGYFVSPQSGGSMKEQLGAFTNLCTETHFHMTHPCVCETTEESFIDPRLHSKQPVDETLWVFVISSNVLIVRDRLTTVVFYSCYEFWNHSSRYALGYAVGLDTESHYSFKLVFVDIFQIGTIRSMLNELLAAPVCRAPVDEQTTISGSMWYWRKLKNLMILRQVLQLKSMFSYKQIYGCLFLMDIVVEGLRF